MHNANRGDGASTSRNGRSDTQSLLEWRSAILILMFLKVTNPC